MDREGLSWYLFGGVVFVCMGLGLALDAPAHARLAAEWPGGRGRRGLVWVYRAVGWSFCAAGACLVAGLAFCPEALASWLKPVRLGRGGRLAGGLFFTLAGLALARLKDWELASPRRLPAVLEAQAAPEGRAGWAGRAALWSGWVLVASLLSFGIMLVSRSFREVP